MCDHTLAQWLEHLPSNYGVQGSNQITLTPTLLSYITVTLIYVSNSCTLLCVYILFINYYLLASLNIYFYFASLNIYFLLVLHYHSILTINIFSWMYILKIWNFHIVKLVRASNVWTFYAVKCFMKYSMYTGIPGMFSVNY